MHTRQITPGLRLSLVFVAWTNRSISTSPWMRCLSIAGLPPPVNSPFPLITWVVRDTMRVKLHLHLQLHDLFTKSYEDIQQIPVQSALWCGHRFVNLPKSGGETGTTESRSLPPPPPTPPKKAMPQQPTKRKKQQILAWVFETFIHSNIT